MNVQSQSQIIEESILPNKFENKETQDVRRIEVQNQRCASVSQDLLIRELTAEKPHFQPIDQMNAFVIPALKHSFDPPPIIPLQSNCQFLFGKEFHEIDCLANFAEEVVNQSLNALMEHICTFMSREKNDAFPLIDPSVGNNQCHLYSFYASQMKQKYSQMSLQEKLTQTEENRFLFLSFFTSLPFSRHPRLMTDVIKTAFKKGEISLPPHLSQKDFFEFIPIINQKLMPYGRQALIELFEKRIKRDLAQNNIPNDPLLSELSELTQEKDLYLLPPRGETPVYTLPKLAGVAYLIHQSFPFVIKTKVITSQGNGTLFYQSHPKLKMDAPVLVFETFASDEISMEKFQSITAHCPSYFERVPSKQRKPHKEKTCLFCQDKPLNDLSVYQKRFDQAMQTIDESLYAVGSDFMRTYQKPFLKFYNDPEKYPLLTKIFQQAMANIEPLGLSMQTPRTFTVLHVYMDSLEHVVQEDMRMNSSPEAFLKNRGFL